MAVSWRERPDLVLVQGDTTSAMAAAMAAFYARVPVGHVEAGLRTGDLANPYPEEMNRRVITVLGALHFAPTATARLTLLTEGVPADRVHLTGNTVVDALQAVAERAMVATPGYSTRRGGIVRSADPGGSTQVGRTRRRLPRSIVRAASPTPAAWHSA